MNAKLIAKKICCCGISAALSAICLLSVPPVTADTMSDLEARQNKLDKQLKDVEAALKDYESQAEESAEYLEEYDNKMKIQEEQIAVIEQQIALFEEDIAELEANIAESEESVEEGVEQFGQRLRALYMSGSDSMASVLTGSSDFYDMLARMEFVERVSKHDNELIDTLNVQIAELEASKAEYEQKLEDMENKKAEEEKYYEELRETYNNHAETKKMQENMIADYEKRADEIERDQQQIEAD